MALPSTFVLVHYHCFFHDEGIFHSYLLTSMSHMWLQHQAALELGLEKADIFPRESASQFLFQFITNTSQERLLAQPHAPAAHQGPRYCHPSSTFQPAVPMRAMSQILLPATPEQGAAALLVPPCPKTSYFSHRGAWCEPHTIGIYHKKHPFFFPGIEGCALGPDSSSLKDVFVLLTLY